MSSVRNSKIVAIANQKGGVGKTTTAINLATTLAAVGRKVLLVDLDGQGNASTGVGVDLNKRKLTTYDIFFGVHRIDDVAININTVPGLYVAPATTDLSSIDVALVSDRDRAVKLKQAIQNCETHYDYIIIDCPPSLNLLTVNALVAADSVIVPLQTEFFALEGLSQLLQTVQEVKQTANPRLEIQGIVLTMYDRRNNLSQQVEIDVRDNMGTMVFKTVIPRNIRLSEAPSHSVPALLYDPKSAGSIAYQKLALEFLARVNDDLTEDMAV